MKTLKRFLKEADEGIPESIIIGNPLGKYAKLQIDESCVELTLRDEIKESSLKLFFGWASEDCARDVAERFITESFSISPRPSPIEIRQIMNESADRVEKRQGKSRLSSAARTLGHEGGKKGGPARARKLSSKRKKEIARKGAKARWGGSSKKKSED